MKKITLVLFLLAYALMNAQTFTEQPVDLNFTDGLSTFIIDLDGDGDQDVLAINASEVAWYSNDGSQAFTKTTIDNTLTYGIYVTAGDIDGDGDNDVLINDYSGNKVILYLNDGSEVFTSLVVDTAATGSNFADFGDIDGDGDMDIVAANYLGNEIAKYISDGATPPVFTKTTVDTLTQASSVDLADVDGDGDMDIVATSLSGNEVALYINDASAAFTKQSITTTFMGAITAYAADIDGDGDLDIVGSASTGNEVAWFENDGATPPVFTTHSLDTATNYASFAQAADMDGDGNMDIVACATTANEVVWFKSDGATPPAFTKMTLNTVANAYGLHLGDVDSDGDMDVSVSASGTADDILWFENGAPLNDTFAGAIPITPTAEGTGCATSQFTIDFAADGTTDSGMDNVCNGTDTGLDQFFTWTATSLALRWTYNAPGNPGITIYSDTGVEINCSGTFQNRDLSGWELGDNLVIQIYDYGTSVSPVAFCLEELTPPANDLITGAIPITVDLEGTCNTQTLLFDTDNTAQSNLIGSCNGNLTGRDQFFTWTATSIGLNWDSQSPGGPGIIVRDTAGVEIDCINTLTDGVLSGWTIGDSLIIQIYDYANSDSDVAFCLSEVTAFDPTATFTTNEDCANDRFSVAIDITSLGGAGTVTISDDNTNTLDQTVSTVGIVNFGYYDAGTTVNYTITNNDDTTFETTGSVTYNCPPANDDCMDAVPLTIGVTPTDNPVDGTVLGATVGTETAGCGSNGPGVWYSVVVPSDGIVNIETAADSTGDTGFDSVIEAFSGDCTTGLTSIDCDDDGAATGSFSKLELTGLTAGDTIYIRVWEYGGNDDEPFSIAAYNPASASTNNLSLVGFNYYPNPVTNELTMTANENISSISIYNMLGQEVKSSTPSALETKIDMTNLANGTYFVKAQVGNSVGTFKVIKK